jgi:hypothetical protein
MAGLALEEAKCHAFFRLCPDLGALIFAFWQKLDRCASPSSGGCVDFWAAYCTRNLVADAEQLYG